MIQIGNVPAIVEVKDQLNALQEQGMIKEWELPYENLLTRLTAAIFFLTPTDDNYIEMVWQELEKYPMFTCRENTEKTLSQLEWRVEFNKDFEL